MVSITSELMPFDQLTVDKMIVADDDSYTTARDSTSMLAMGRLLLAVMSGPNSVSTSQTSHPNAVPRTLR